jgi:2-keto-4-pentenoate hydratase
VENWTIGFEDTLAECASNRSIILGGQLQRLNELDLGHTRGHLNFNGQEVVWGTTRKIMRNLYAAVAWLVNGLVEFDIGFEAGQVILLGGWLQARPKESKGRWECTYDGWDTTVFLCNSEAKQKTGK